MPYLVVTVPWCLDIDMTVCVCIRVQIHFLGFASRYDESFRVGSSKIRAVGTFTYDKYMPPNRSRVPGGRRSRSVSPGRTGLCVTLLGAAVTIFVFL